MAIRSGDLQQVLLKMKIASILIGILLLTNLAYGQKGYQSGKIYKVDGSVSLGTMKLRPTIYGLTISYISKIKFKPNNQAPPVKYKPSDLVGFVMEQDSFGVVSNVKIAQMRTFSKDVARVILVGKLNLLEHICENSGNTGANGMSYSSTVKTLIIHDSRSNKTLSIYNIKKNSAQVLNMIADDEELTGYLKNKPPKSWDIVEIVTRYNKMQT